MGQESGSGLGGFLEPGSTSQGLSWSCSQEIGQHSSEAYLGLKGYFLGGSLAS